MSWWDTSQFTSIASNAIKNAQKKIDKVLDIPAEEDGHSTVSSFKSSAAEKSSWSTWGSPTALLSSTPKSPTFEQPTSSSSPTHIVQSTKRQEPSHSPVIAEHKYDSIADPFEAAPEKLPIGDGTSTSSSSPSTPRKEKPERRRAVRHRSSEKPSAPKKLGAVKLGAVKLSALKVAEIESPPSPVEPTLSDAPATSQSQTDSALEKHPTVETSTTVVQLDSEVNSAADEVLVTDISGQESSIHINQALSGADEVEDIVAREDNSTVEPADTPMDQSTSIDQSDSRLPVNLSNVEVTVESSDAEAVEKTPFDNVNDDSHNPTVSYIDSSIESSDAPHTAAETTASDIDFSKVLFSKSIESDTVLVTADDAPATECTESTTVSDADIAHAAADNAEDSLLDHTPQNEFTLVKVASGVNSNSASSEGTVVDQVTVGPPDNIAAEGQSSLTDSMATMELSTCSDNSYVKCELPTSLNGTDSGTGFHRRAPSEFSDFETATSSDIEIISMPSTYGDGNGEARMMDFVPLSRSVFKTRIRNISPDDEILVSPLQLSPGSDKDTSSSSTSDKSAAQMEIREAENSVNSTMIKKVSQLTEVLEVRENRLLAMSREHSELLEVNAHLKRRIEQMEETNGDLNLVKSEFGQRLHDVERKLHNALREKELVKKQYLSAQEELQNRIGTSGKMQRIVEEKDEQISSLLAEGEKLTKQQLTSNNLIKKLRKKEKEQEELNRDQRDKIDSQNAELERLKAVLDSKIQNEGKHTELIKQLNSAVSSYQSESSKLKSDAEEALERQKRAESAVDNSYKEIAELHKSMAAKDAEIRELKLGNDAHMKEEFQLALDRKHKESLRDADHLTSQIEDMRLTISRMEKDQNRREECLRQEKQDLLDRLEEADKRNDELTQSVAAATKPLLRQIENLQSSYSTQSMSWERVEKNLTDRLADSQSRLAAANEKERQSTESSLELSSQVSILESQLSSLKQEKCKLMAELEVSKMRISTLQDERNSAITHLEAYKANMEADSVELRKSYALLENNLELERTKLEGEKKKCVNLLDQLNEKDQQIHELSVSRLTSTPSPSFAADDGRSSAMKRSMKQDELLERALSTSSMTGSSLYDNMRNHSTTSLLESLESQVKQREGEIAQLQADIVEHEKTRESLTKEMVKLTEENSRQDIKIKEQARLHQQYKELNGRYQALLQMYGEKEEQVTELRMDLMDVKQMYKQQIDALMSK